MFPSLYGAVSQGAAAASWWVVAGKTCVAAYQPIGAASLAASYTNLANPGTYDAAPGVAPTWASGTGWGFVRSSATYLKTGVEFAIPIKPSVIVRYSDFSVWWGSFFGSIEPGTSARVQIANIGATISARYASLVSTAVVATTEPGLSGVLAVAGGYGYLNGAVNTALMTQLNRPTAEIYIGALKLTTGLPADFIQANIQALAIYSDTLTAGEVATVSAAMAALT